MKKRIMQAILMLACLITLAGCTSAEKGRDSSGAGGQADNSEDDSQSQTQDADDIYQTDYIDLEEDEKQKMIYVFDPLAERVFFIELSEIITGKDLDKAVCTRKNGEAPQQTIDFDEQMNTNAALDLDENFYGDQDYDMEDFDPEGFDINEGSGNPYDEDKY